MLLISMNSAKVLYSPIAKVVVLLLARNDEIMKWPIWMSVVRPSTGTRLNEGMNGRCGRQANAKTASASARSNA